MCYCEKQHGIVHSGHHNNQLLHGILLVNWLLVTLLDQVYWCIQHRWVPRQYFGQDWDAAVSVFLGSALDLLQYWDISVSSQHFCFGPTLFKPRRVLFTCQCLFSKLCHLYGSPIILPILPILANPANPANPSNPYLPYSLPILPTNRRPLPQSQRQKSII